MTQINHVTLRFDESAQLLGAGEPDQWVYETAGEIVVSRYEFEGEGEVLAGRFRVLYVDMLRAQEEGEAAEYVFDAEHGTLELYESLFQVGTWGLKAAVQRLVDTFDTIYFGQGILVLDRIEVLPQFRGRDVALEVLRELMWRCGRGADLAALKAFPLQFEVKGRNDERRKRLGLDEFPADQRVATNRLCRYYRRLGFLRVPGTSYMVAPAIPVGPVARRS